MSEKYTLHVDRDQIADALDQYTQELEMQEINFLDAADAIIAYLVEPDTAK